MDNNNGMSYADFAALSNNGANGQWNNPFIYLLWMMFFGNGGNGFGFGGGNAAKIIGNTTVNVATKATETFDSVADDPSTTADERVKTVVGADIRGNVFGGGNNAAVTGDSHVNIGKERE